MMRRIKKEPIMATQLDAAAGIEQLTPAPAMTLPPPVEVPYSEIEKLLAVGAKYGIEFVLPKPE